MSDSDMSDIKTIDFDAIASKYPMHQTVESPWPLFAAAVLAAQCQFEEEEYLEQLWKYLITHHQPHQIKLILARRLREAFLKISPLIGFARGINILTALAAVLRKATPEVQAAMEKDKPLREGLSDHYLERRGAQFFQKIYERHSERILDNLAKISGGDLHVFVYVAIYGELMAETRIIDDKDTVMLEFVVCFATLAGPQAKGHFFGSRNVGNSKAEMQGTMAMMAEIYRQLGVPFPDGVQKYGMINFTEKVETWT